MKNLPVESAVTQVLDRMQPEKRNNGSGLSDVSLRKYIELIEDLNGGHSRPVIASQDLLNLSNTQNMLRRTEEKVRRMFDNSFDGIAVLDLNGIVTEMNRKMIEMGGLGSEVEILGRSYLDFIACSDRDRVDTEVRKTLSGERINDLECTVIRNDGTGISAEINAIALNDVYNYPLGLLLSIKNVSRCRHAAEANRLSREKIRVMGEIIEAMAHMVEIRDPYTAGHQRRVAGLAAAIAVEMGLSGETVEGVRVAGMVHDIGKIYIPAEILSKPTVLNEMEYRMVKQHPKLSFDILRTIEFPWPVATIVHQHHERLDGSGYPAGLSGEDIIIEARILAVADVVEAMASHRPYRPALGIEKALEEISIQRGILYDPGVVDACVKLLNGEKSFSFS